MTASRVGPTRAFAALERALATVVLGVVLAAGCAGPAGTGPVRTTPPAAPSATPGPAVAHTRAAIEAALGERSVQLRAARVPYRPAEATALTGVPRAVYQAVLPEDPEHGFIVVYDLPNARSAQAAAEAQASYVASPIGRVQFPFGTQFVIRRLGSTVIFYAEPPESPDDQAPDVAEALRTVGTEVSVPS